MPLFAVTAPPCGPVVGRAAGELDGVGVALALAFGRVAFAPSRTSTWPAGTVELAAAVTLNSDAILPALAAEPEPYSTSVVASGLVLPTLPAVYPALTRAADTCPARPAVLPPLRTSTVVRLGFTEAETVGRGCAEAERCGG